LVLPNNHQKKNPHTQKAKKKQKQKQKHESDFVAYISRKSVHN